MNQAEQSPLWDDDTIGTRYKEVFGKYIDVWHFAFILGIRNDYERRIAELEAKLEKVQAGGG